MSCNLKYLKGSIFKYFYLIQKNDFKVGVFNGIQIEIMVKAMILEKIF